MPVVAENVILSYVKLHRVKLTILSPGNETKGVYRTYERLGGMFNMYNKKTY
jgi:hypothetical protein